MFKRRWKWFGPITSDEGFSLSYAYQTVLYTDNRGTFAFGFEDGVLMPTPFQVKGDPLPIDPATVDKMIERILRALHFDGQSAEVFKPGK